MCVVPANWNSLEAPLECVARITGHGRILRNPNELMERDLVSVALHQAPHHNVRD